VGLRDAKPATIARQTDLIGIKVSTDDSVLALPVCAKAPVRRFFERGHRRVSGLERHAHDEHFAVPCGTMSDQGAHAALDHLIVAAARLADGIDYVARLTGVTPRPGGKHVTMGTHNALLRLGDRIYLEVLAIDPDAAKPARPRWFDLDDAGLQAQLSERPRLIAWAVRTDDIDGAIAFCPVALGRAHPFTRGDYRWRLTIPDDGKRPGEGLLPALIQWDVAAHPADALPDSGVALGGLAGAHPDPDAIGGALAALGLTGVLALTGDRRARLTATLATPRGPVSL
jgi:hypothetical protein